MKAAELMVAALAHEGVERIFAVPGEENLDLVEALRSSSIELILTRHEQAAGFMAATWGRLTGRTGVCLATLGPGATNLVTAAAYAQLGGMPMLMITGQKPLANRDQGHFQIIDAVDMMRPLTKHTRQLADASVIPTAVREACRLAEEERPGAVHLELPEDVARERADRAPLDASLVRRPIAEDKAVEAALDALRGARHPLLVIGAGANRKRTARMLERMIERTGIPFVATQMGKGVVDERHPGYVGTAAISAGDLVHAALERADVIVNVGHDVIEKPPFVMRPGGRTVIHVHFFPASVDPVYFPQIEVVGDIANAIWQFAEALDPSPDWDFACFHEVKRAVDAHTARCDEADAMSPLCPRRVVADVRAVLPSDGIVALDNGMYKIWFARNYRAHGANALLLDNALASMGAGLPSAIAAKLVHPDRPILAVCGDGGFMMNSQELETAVRLGVDLAVVVLRDDELGMIRWKQEADGHGDYGLDFGNPDFVAYARSYGAEGHRVARAEDLAPTLDRALRADGVHLIEVPVDYGPSNRVLDEEIPRLAAELER